MQDFLLFQYCLSILALCYLQALICYYDQKENLHHKRHLRLLERLSEDQATEFENVTPLGAVEEADSYDYSSPMVQRYELSGERSECETPRDYSFDGNISDHSRSFEHSSNNGEFHDYLITTRAIPDVLIWYVYVHQYLKRGGIFQSLLSSVLYFWFTDEDG